jgi:hypothetical protein
MIQQNYQVAHDHSLQMKDHVFELKFYLWWESPTSVAGVVQPRRWLDWLHFSSSSPKDWNSSINWHLWQLLMFILTSLQYQVGLPFITSTGQLGRSFFILVSIQYYGFFDPHKWLGLHPLGVYSDFPSLNTTLLTKTVILLRIELRTHKCSPQCQNRCSDVYTYDITHSMKECMQGRM